MLQIKWVLMNTDTVTDQTWRGSEDPWAEVPLIQNPSILNDQQGKSVSLIR